MISVIKRDGMARIATLSLNYNIGSRSSFSEKNKIELTTPLMINYLDKDNYRFVDEIDFGFAPSSLKFIDKERYEVLKSKDDKFKVITGLNKLFPKKKVDLILESRADGWCPLYTPCLATPQNLPLLVYLGVDIVDNILPIVEAYNGTYMLGEGMLDFETIRELPCNCSICSEYAPEEVKAMNIDKKAELIGLHNTFALENQITLVREQIRSENLRNFVEARTKTDPELTAMLRFADVNEEFKRKYPLFKRSKALFTSLELNRPEVTNFFEKSISAYDPAGKTLLLLPCSATKPYSFSKTHIALKRMVNLRGVNEIIISSPLVSPREFELCYPVVNYDTTVTGEWTDDEINFVADKLSKFIMKGGFNKIIAHVEKDYERIVQKAIEKIGYSTEADAEIDVEIVYTGKGGILSKKAIENLKRELKSAERVKFNLYSEIFTHMARYQFGLDLRHISHLSYHSHRSDSDPFQCNPSGKFKIGGKYPNLELYRDSESGTAKTRERIMRIDMRFGMLDIDLPLAEEVLFNECEIHKNPEGIPRVKIDEFVPKGTIFAPGVDEANSYIKPNDIIIFSNKKAFGVGLAKMYGEEMVEVESGHAIEVRRVRLK